MPPVQASDPLVLHALGEDDGGAAADVLAEAFAADPTLRWCFEADEPGFADRLRAYVRIGHRWHTAQGHPAHGARAGRELVAALYVALPEAPTPLALGDLEAELAAACGPRAAGRFARYNQAVEEATPEGRFHVLALLGVRPAWQGRGVGSRLIDWTAELCDADPGSGGVVLDTGSDANVRFYARHGYRPVAAVEIGPLREHVLLRDARRD